MNDYDFFKANDYDFIEFSCNMGKSIQIKKHHKKKYSNEVNKKEFNLHAHNVYRVLQPPPIAIYGVIDYQLTN